MNLCDKLFPNRKLYNLSCGLELGHKGEHLAKGDLIVSWWNEEQNPQIHKLTLSGSQITERKEDNAKP